MTQRATHKGHGRPSTFTYFGNRKEADAIGTPVVTGATVAYNAIELRHAVTGDLVTSILPAEKFWAES